MQFAVRACLFTAVILSLGCSHYTEEEKWSVCCALYIDNDGASSSPARATIIAWQRRTWFDGDGSAGETLTSRRNRETWKNEQIAAAIAEFLIGNPGGLATGYLVSLGMACQPKAGTGRDAVQCEIGLPIRVKCGPTYRWLPGTTPIPDQLRTPIPATLGMTVDLSGNAVVDSRTRIDPLPGGHLCHR